MKSDNKTDDDYEWFAFGRDNVRTDDFDCDCPAVAAGFSPKKGDHVIAVANRYDRILRESGFSGPGRVPEPTAREAWLQAIDELEEVYPNHDDMPLFEEGRDVAEHLGWSK